MSSDATFQTHIHNVVLKAKLMCGWILRTFATRASHVMLTLWKSLVQPILDYCSQLWSPTTPGLIQELEMVQRSFLRKIPSLRSLSYWQQLKKLRKNSLQRRRERYMIIYMWKLREGHVTNFADSQVKYNHRLSWLVL